jgi:hypothetical protein
MLVASTMMAAAQATAKTSIPSSAAIIAQLLFRGTSTATCDRRNRSCSTL